ncbi:MAG: glycosyltransferase family 2 protein [Flavobacteriales bacterium]|nr:glycosyltransferase family 2 protein [Flavobacteriales bacterium]MCB9166892.1 glycosyltransferase family 2 protein [Flavobacteriales bacterium]
MDISAVIITHNEAHNISRCLEAAARVADELIVVDAESTDGTVAIAGSSGARVTVRAWTNYSDQKNFANDLARGPYILSLDADEVLGDELTADILRQKATGLHGAYRLKRLTNYCGQWVRHGGWYPDAKVRLFPKQGVRWEGDHVHEILALPSGTAITDLKGDLLHFSYRSVDDHRDRIDRYSTLHAKALFAKGRGGGPVKRLLAPLVKFAQGYILQGGFRDGWAGWTIAVMSSRAVRLKYEKLDALRRGKAI